MNLETLDACKHVFRDVASLQSEALQVFSQIFARLEEYLSRVEGAIDVVDYEVRRPASAELSEDVCR